MLVTMAISGEDVCYSVVFGTLACVSVFSVIWFELLMKSAVSCSRWLAMRTLVKLCTLGIFALWGELGFLNCDDICMCVVNKQFELPEFF